MKTIISVILLLTAFCLAAKPTGHYDLRAHANFFGDGASNSVRLAEGTLSNGRCEYVGKVNLPARGGECPDILILHLYAIRGGAEGLQCSYDQTVFDDEVFVNYGYRKHCPDLLAVTQVTFQVLGEFDFGREDNQADYWDPDNHCGFTYDIDPEFFAEHDELKSQVLYRFRYDWVNRKQYSRTSW